jgi:alanine-glyoxylate transaminase/serine-glyoxylate transaminase/serine-pyruvate transaminase
MAGSGTLAMDMAGANLIESGDRALVIATGYFGDRFAELLKRYGAQVTVLKAPLGDVVPLDRIESELKNGQYKLLTFTHVDTSTAVKVDPEAIANLGRGHGVLTVLDGVCSVAGEEIRQQKWGIDVVLTASQKAIGVPPGLALLVVSPLAIDVFRKRETPVGNYYADWNHWLPIMEAYAEARPAYFGTPPVNLIAALDVSLRMILAEGLRVRFERHRRIGRAFRAAMHALGLDMIPVNETVAANTLSAPRYPAGVNGAEFLGHVAASGVIVAGGLLADIKDEYFRVGHMGAVNAADILATVGAIESALRKCGHRCEPGAGLAAAQTILDS